MAGIKAVAPDAVSGGTSYNLMSLRGWKGAITTAFGLAVFALLAFMFWMAGRPSAERGGQRIRGAVTGESGGSGGDKWGRW